MQLTALIGSMLAEPATRGMDLDDPSTTIQRRNLSKTKRSLYHCNVDWYRRLKCIEETAPEGLRVEIGSGGGHLEEHVPGLIKTDLLPLPFVDQVCNAENMPFHDTSIGTLFMINVLHHIIHPTRFFDEVNRVLVPDGVLAMIEPDVTFFSKIVYRHFHPEPFDSKAELWDLEESGPLSGGNDAMPWNIFVRDRVKFDKDESQIERRTD